MKRYLEKNVYDAAIDRIKYVFKEFDNILVAFSGGKDSGVMLNLTYQYAKETNQLHKLAMYYQDYEADYKFTHEYAEREFARLAGIKKYWLCLPIAAACSVSMQQSTWIPWNRDKKDIWVREMPTAEYVVNEENCPYGFVKGTKGFDCRVDFAKWFSSKYGKTAVFIGLRADESLSRLAVITSAGRKFMYKGLRYTKAVNDLTYNFYPLYDWGTTDIWAANAKLGFDYNKVYDLFYKAGLPVATMRTASPFHQCGQANLRLFQVIDPDSWGKMIGRVNGVNFTGIYGGTTAMGWHNITKPAHFTWKQYAFFLLNTLPEQTREIYLNKIKKSQWHWKEQGGGRSEEFIQQLEAEGWKIRRTGKMANRGYKQKELVYIDEMRDDTDVDEFKRAPTWKRVCITIMKNDTTCLSMGFQRTKAQLDKRKQTINKYKNL